MTWIHLLKNQSCVMMESRISLHHALLIMIINQNSIVCCNEEDMFQHVLMPFQFILGDECKELVRVDMLETDIISNNILPIPLQVTLYAVDQIVPKLSNHEDTCEPIDAAGKDEEKGQSSHDDFVETYESYNTECYDAEIYYNSNYDYLMPNKDECEFEVGRSFNEAFNTLFDEEVNMDRPLLCLNIYEKGFHMISNPLYEEMVEKPEMVKIGQNVNAELIFQS